MDKRRDESKGRRMQREEAAGSRLGGQSCEVQEPQEGGGFDVEADGFTLLMACVLVSMV